MLFGVRLKAANEREAVEVSAVLDIALVTHRMMNESVNDELVPTQIIIIVHQR